MEETAGTGNAFPDFTYEYDKVGNISKLTTLSTAGTDTQTYTYDDLNRLLTASATGGVANYSQTYAYNQIGNMTSFAGTVYAYNDAAHKQAVTHLGGVQKFWYDANGNMTTRIDGSITYTQLFDVENRLTSVTPSGGSATTFAYDANGIRTKTVQPGGITTYFPFPGYEETVNGANTIKRSSYSFAGQTVALRVSGDPVSGNNGLFYVLSDHLGSTSMLVNSSGGVVAGSTTRNLPYGGYRPGSAPTQTITDRDFTGQKENMELGLLYYQARFYVPGIGRFASADTIVPNPANPQSYNRYSYVLNSPTVLVDPSGHNPVCNSDNTLCSDGAYDDGQLVRELKRKTFSRQDLKYIAVGLMAENSGNIHSSQATELQAWAWLNRAPAGDTFNNIDSSANPDDCPTGAGSCGAWYGLIEPYLDKPYGEATMAERQTALQAAIDCFTRPGCSSYEDSYSSALSAVTNAYREYSMGVNDPTNGSTQFSHQGLERSSGFVFASKEDLHDWLTTNFNNHQQQNPDFHFAISDPYIVRDRNQRELYPLVFVTGTDNCVHYGSCGLGND